MKGRGARSRGDIVVVEDRPENLRLLVSLLSEQGYRVRPAPTGKHALRTIEKNVPDLVLLDIMLPDLDGYEVCRRLQEKEHTREIPIIFLSALDEVENKMKGFAAGGVDYITKPFHSQEVLARVSTHLKIRALQDELREEVARFKILTEAAFEGIIIHSEARILDLNHEAIRLLGSSEIELVGNNLFDIIPWQFHTGGEVPQQEEIIRSDGTVLNVEIRTKNLLTKEREVSVTAIRDLTQEREFEQEKNRLLQENRALRVSMQDRYKFGKFIGRSPAMQGVYELITKAAATDYSVVVTGESGTGKELTAKTIHELSARQNKPFVVVNCGAVTESLFEREFFGHKKGAFTDARRDEPGFFDAVNGGTLFLDEISEIPLTLQVKLLRVLENGEYIPVGDSVSQKTDIRIVAATNKKLLDMVRQGKFREDLFYRIHVIEIELPPLRDRREDIQLLAEHFLLQDGAGDKMVKFPDSLRNMMFNYDWPGNIRELKNAVHRYLATDNLVFPEHHHDKYGSEFPLKQGLKSALDSLEKEMIIEALEKTHWHRGNTAELLQIPRRTLQRKMLKYNLNPLRNDET